MRGDQYLYGDEAADTVDVSEYGGCMCGFCVIQFIVEKGGLVPVELCEHGKYNPHRTPNVNPTIGWGDFRYCPGAGIRGDDD